MNWRLFLMWPLWIVGGALVLLGGLLTAVILWPVTLWIDPSSGTNLEGDRVQL